jgi:nitrogenase iron protein
MQIAIYGKGGIGKSTVSANLSAALALLGCRVLQIGCDPKHDSTRLLHHGRKVTTVLDYILNTPPDDQKASDVLMEGYLGTGCIEAGGPRPGKGCAGRGILTSFDFLNEHSVLKGYDTIVYDVLGDVVCGGFAVPVRPQYAQAVFLVTSGEAMSIYAANNILSGIRNLDEGGKRIAGIIYNSRGAGDDKEKVMEFAKAVGLPICLSIPRSESFLEAEKKALTQVEMDKESREARLFLELAANIKKGLILYPAQPLDEEQMEAFMQGKKIEELQKEGSGPVKNSLSFGSSCEDCPEAALPEEKKENEIRPIPKKRALSDPFSRMPLFGCAFRGAMDLAVQVKDAAVLGHAPKSCTSYAANGITSYGRNGLYARGVIYPAFIPQHFDNTDINIQDAIFGGVEHAREKALALAAKGIKDIIVVTACIPGLSGDDLEPLKAELKAKGVDMYIVKSDGVEEGSYNDGMALCYKTLAREAVKPVTEVDKDSLNLVYELSWSLKTQDDQLVLEGLLKELGIRVNCRFLYDTSIRDINGFLKAPFSLMAREDKLGLEIKKIFEDRYGCRFLKGTMPRGFGETKRFIEEIGTLYSKEEAAAALISKYTRIYEERLQSIKRSFEGKRVMIFKNSPVPWLEDLVSDLGLDVVWSFLPKESKKKDPEWRHAFSAEWKKDVEDFGKKIEELGPDLVLSTDPAILVVAAKAEKCKAVLIGRNTGVGFLSGIDEAKKWLEVSVKELKGRWRNDRAVFEKYYS